MGMPEHLGTRILRTTMGLRMLEADLRAAIELVDRPPHVEAIDAKIAAEFRDALARMGQRLWVLMQSDAELAHVFRACGSSELSQLGAAPSFMEHVQTLASKTLDKHAKKTGTA